MGYQEHHRTHHGDRFRRVVIIIAIPLGLALAASFFSGVVLFGDYTLTHVRGEMIGSQTVYVFLYGFCVPNNKGGFSQTEDQYIFYGPKMTHLSRANIPCQPKFSDTVYNNFIKNNRKQSIQPRRSI